MNQNQFANMIYTTYLQLIKKALQLILSDDIFDEDGEINGDYDHNWNLHELNDILVGFDKYLADESRCYTFINEETVNKIIRQYKRFIKKLCVQHESLVDSINNVLSSELFMVNEKDISADIINQFLFRVMRNMTIFHFNDNFSYKINPQTADYIYTNFQYSRNDYIRVMAMFFSAFSDRKDLRKGITLLKLLEDPFFYKMSEDKELNNIIDNLIFLASEHSCGFTATELHAKCLIGQTIAQIKPNL